MAAAEVFSQEPLSTCDPSHVKSASLTATPKLPAGQKTGIWGQAVGTHVEHEVAHPTDPSDSGAPVPVLTQRCCVELHEGFSSQNVCPGGSTRCSVTVPGEVDPESPVPSFGSRVRSTTRWRRCQRKCGQ